MEEKLRKIQLCQLEILKEIVRICDKHDIEYWLAYGTMLGAIRHKGSIPWDDDLDIYMTMEGFRKFQRISKTELSPDYFLQTPDSEPTMGWLFYKVRKNGTQMLEPQQTSDNKNFNFGIWVDIFPLININDEKKKRQYQYKLLRKLQYYRGCHPSISKDITLKNMAKTIYTRALLLYEKMLWSIVIFLGGSDSKSLMVVDCQFYSHVKEASYPSKIFDRSSFLSYSNYEFEDSYFKGITDYDSYLIKCYSKDYMVPKKYNVHTEDYSKVIV